MKENEFNILDELDLENYEKDVEESERKLQSMKEELYNNVYITFKSSWDEYLEEKLQKQKIENREKQRLKLLQIALSKKEETTEKTEEKEKSIPQTDKTIRKGIKGKGTIPKGIEESSEEKERKEKERKEKELLKKQEEEKLKKAIEEEKELQRRKIELELEETIKIKRKEYKMHILIESNVIDKETQLNDKEILERVLQCFTVPVKLYKQGIEKQIQSEFYIPQQSIDFPILKDMFFNNYLYKKFLQLDERLSIYKYKKNLYFYFIPDINSSKNNYIACSLVQKKVEKIDTKIIAKDPSKLTIGSNYI